MCTLLLLLLVPNPIPVPVPVPVDLRGPFYPTLTLFPQLATIHSSPIQQELNHVLHKESLWKQWPEPLAIPDQRWKTIPLYGFGQWSIQSQSFPRLCHRIRRLPGLRLAILSKLEPHVVLRPHEGWAFHSNHVLRNHLPIQLPKHKEACQILVKPNRHRGTPFHVRSYQKNQWITFDDSLPHYAVNGTDEDRIVLIIDMVRPPQLPSVHPPVRKQKSSKTLFVRTQGVVHRQQQHIHLGHHGRIHRVRLF